MALTLGSRRSSGCACNEPHGMCCQKARHATPCEGCAWREAPYQSDEALQAPDLVLDGCVRLLLPFFCMILPAAGTGIRLGPILLELFLETRRLHCLGGGVFHGTWPGSYVRTECDRNGTSERPGREPGPCSSLQSSPQSRACPTEAMSHGPPQQQQQNVVEHQREPCPDRIIDDIGGAFGMGAVGGGVWHLIKGMKNSPPGFRVRGAVEVRGVVERS